MKYALFILILIGPAKQLFAENRDASQTKEIIAQHILASGGSDALMEMQSISRYGRITIYESDKVKDNFCYHTDLVYQTKLREQLKGNEILVDRGTDSTAFWSWVGNKYEFTNDVALNEYMVGVMQRANREMVWVMDESENYTIMTSQPAWAPGDSQCIQQIKSNEAVKRIYCFNPATGLMNALGSDSEYRLESDWRWVGNIKIPFHLTHYMNGIASYEVQLDHAELNKDIPQYQFIKPDKPQYSC